MHKRTEHGHDETKLPNHDRVYNIPLSAELDTALLSIFTNKLTGMVSEAVLSDLIGQIYDSATDASLWPVFLESFSDAVGGGPTALARHDMTVLRPTLALSTRMDLSAERLYMEHYGKSDPLRAAWLQRFSTANPDVVVTSEQLIEPADLQKTEFYQDYLIPYDMVHQVCGPIFLNRHSAAVLTCLRSARKGPFGSQAVTLLRLLLPHLQRALEFDERITKLQAERDTSIELLDLLSAGLILVDRYAHVLLMNRAARQIIDQNDGLAVKRRELIAAVRDETTALHRLVHEAWVTCSGAGFLSARGSLAVSRPSGRRRLSLLVVPVRSSQSRIRLLAGVQIPSAVILISDPEAETVPNSKALEQSFGLTPAEAKLASLLSVGKSLDEATHQLEISKNTAKTQLKEIFSKTDTSRQGELIRILLLSHTQIQR